MTDMNVTIAPNSDQINADDLIGGPRTITITRVKAAPQSDKQPVSVYFEGDDGKPFRPCKSMRRVMVHVWGADANEYNGKSMTLYLDPKVKFGGMEVGGIRISHMSHIDQKITMGLTATRARRVPFTVMPLIVKDSPQVDVSAMQSDAKQAAGGGKDAFAVWWNTEYGKTCREHVTPIMSEIQDIVAKADETNQGENHE